MEEKLRSIFKKKFWVGAVCFSVIPIAAILMLTVFLLSYFDVMPIFHMRTIHEKLALVFSVSLIVCGSIIGVKRFLLPYAAPRAGGKIVQERQGNLTPPPPRTADYRLRREYTGNLRAFSPEEPPRYFGMVYMK